MIHITGLPYIIGIFAVGIIGNILVRRIKPRTGKMLAMVVCCGIMIYLMMIWMRA